MLEVPVISDVRLTLAPLEDGRRGLLGVIRWDTGPFRVGGETRGWTWARRLSCRRDRARADHPYLCPLEERAHSELEDEVLKALGVCTDE